MPLQTPRKAANSGLETKVKLRKLSVALVLLCGSLMSHAQTAWQKKVQQELPLLGHRNWIVIVDSAYPLQNSTGIEVVDTGADHLAVLDYVLAAIKASPHVRPLVHLDKELQFVPESQAPGVDRFREELNKRFTGVAPDFALHEVLIHKLSDTAGSFHVLVLKTNMTIPYTSVFLQLDCKYWSAESEARMRDAMKAK
jgi:hypothetical protein